MKNADSANITSVSNFLNNEVVEFASYSTLRAIASLVDGQKNAGRKVLWYCLNHKFNSEKVQNLAGKVSLYTEYLHGDISGSIITLAQNHAGSNNVPMLKRKGNFGSRYSGNSGNSAVRYIYTAPEDYLELYFIPSDREILDEQIFEGTKIEPKFLVPTLPLLLINGSEGIATGFAQKILPRNPADVKKYIINKLKSGTSKVKLLPWYKDFTGTIDEADKPNQYIIRGKFKRLSSRKIQITEIPVGITLSKFNDILDNLQDSGEIRSYNDLSEDDTFKFEVTLSIGTAKLSDDKLISKLKLEKPVTENLTVITSSNRVEIFENIDDILDEYIKIKRSFIQKRKEYLIDELTKSIKIDNSKYWFIKYIHDGELVVNKRRKDEIVNDLKKLSNILKQEDDYDYLLRMPIYSLTKEKMDTLKEQIKVKIKNLKITKETSVEDMWLDDINNIKF